MARPKRSECIRPGHPNHIAVRGNNKRRLFSYPHERLTFLRLLAAGLRKADCALQAVCLMDNHVHLLLTPPSVAAASKCLKHTCQVYAQKRNTARAATGKLFEQRYFSEPILSERQLAFTTMYIEANPLRAGFAHAAEAYPWSSFGFHSHLTQHTKIPPGLVSPSVWYRGLGCTPLERAQRYRQLFADYLGDGQRPDHAEALERFETAAAPYTRRLRRPNGRRASEV